MRCNSCIITEQGICLHLTEGEKYLLNKLESLEVGTPEHLKLYKYLFNNFDN
jgi:hypothetical protein